MEENITKEKKKFLSKIGSIIKKIFLSFKKLTIDSILKLAIIFAILLISLGGFYRYVVYLPAKDKQAQEQEQKDKADKEKKAEEAQKKADAEKSMNTLLRNMCLGDAERAYTELWNKNCNGMGLGDDCRLPNATADNVESQRNNQKNECYKQYPVN